MLAARWRWNLNRALVVPRSRGGQRRPIHLQRMEADDLLAAAWPSLAGCQDNAGPGPVTVPDHVLVRQTVTDCLTEALDAAGLVALLESLEDGRVDVHLVESAEPSPLAHGILTGKPYTYLDGAPLEERRTRAVAVPRGLGPARPRRPASRAPRRRHRAGTARADGGGRGARPGASGAAHARRAPRPAPVAGVVPPGGRVVALVRVPAGRGPRRRAWARDGRRPSAPVPAEAVHRSLTDSSVDADEAVAEGVGGHLEVVGPVTPAELVAEGPLAGGPLHGAPLTEARARTGLARLEAEGSAIELPDGRWCARHLLVRLHAASRSRRRRYVEPCSISDFVRFLACWQHVAEGCRLEGRSGLRSVVQQFQGLEVAAGEWERHVLPARVAGYDPRWLDELCLAGEVAWGRLTPRPEPDLAEADERPSEADATRPSGADAGRSRAGRPPSTFPGRPVGASMTPVARHPAGPRRPRGPGLDPGRRPRRPGASPNPRRARRQTSSPPFGARGPASGPTCRRRPAACPRRSTRASGISWPGAS